MATLTLNGYYLADCKSHIATVKTTLMEFGCDKSAFVLLIISQKTHYTRITCLLKSVPIYLYSTFWRFWIKIRISVKKVQLISINGNTCKISSSTQYHFSLENNHRNENRILWRYNMGYDDIFFHSDVGIPRIIFQRYHPGSFICITKQMTVDCLNFSHELKTDKLEEAFYRRKSWNCMKVI